METIGLGSISAGCQYGFGSSSALYLIGGVAPLAVCLLCFLLIWGKLKQRLY